MGSPIITNFPSLSPSIEVDLSGTTPLTIVEGKPNSVADLMSFSFNIGPGNFIFVPLAEDNFDRNDEDPLNPIVWVTL